ncbi:hypothetical protein MRGA327_21085 [Mycobacterium tuberculosis RGTB327]|nr:hypothetical protein MRGA327_21085 [Mycobacterium tuberculosis RGTB327]
MSKLIEYDETARRAMEVGMEQSWPTPCG